MFIGPGPDRTGLDRGPKKGLDGDRGPDRLGLGPDRTGPDRSEPGPDRERTGPIVAVAAINNTSSNSYKQKSNIGHIFFEILRDSQIYNTTQVQLKVLQTIHVQQARKTSSTQKKFTPNPNTAIKKFTKNSQKNSKLGIRDQIMNTNERPPDQMIFLTNRKIYRSKPMESINNLRTERTRRGEQRTRGGENQIKTEKSKIIESTN